MSNFILDRCDNTIVTNSITSSSDPNSNIDDDTDMGDWYKNAYKKFKIQDYGQYSKYFAVIILPDKDIAEHDARGVVIKKAMKALKRDNVAFFVLYANDVTYENVRHAIATMYNMEMVYWVGHGNSGIWDFNNYDDILDDPDRICRTAVNIYNPKEGFFGKKYVESHMYSYLWPHKVIGKIIDDIGNSDDDCSSFGALNLYNSSKLQFVFMDTCYSGRFIDIPFALGMYSGNNSTNTNRWYMGWRYSVMAGSNLGGAAFSTNPAIGDFWDNFSGKTYKAAITNGLEAINKIGTIKSTFGSDKRDSDYTLYNEIAQKLAIALSDLTGMVFDNNLNGNDNLVLYPSHLLDE